jgi:hypothetical protein
MPASVTVSDRRRWGEEAPMSRQVPWFERTFIFDYPWELYPEQIERVRGTPARARALVAGLAQAKACQRVGDRWSIQENIAHLADLDEELFLPRIEEFVTGATVLKAADVTNAVTNGANHNSRQISDVLERVALVRAGLVRRLESLPHEVFARSALHPRLNKQVRLTDLIFFNAEHDDYHMAHISQLKRELGVSQ